MMCTGVSEAGLSPMGRRAVPVDLGDPNRSLAGSQLAHAWPWWSLSLALDTYLLYLMYFGTVGTL